MPFAAHYCRKCKHLLPGPVYGGLCDRRKSKNENKAPRISEVFKLNENGYSFEEAYALKDVTPQEARREIKKHNMEWEDFIAEVGDKPVYTGEEVLGWLGY